MPKLLLVDDDVEYLALMRAVLESTYLYEVQTAGDGQAALEILQSGDLPDLVISDVMMPKMGGFELMSRLRDVRIDVPVLFTSTTGHESENRILGLRLGAVDFLSKPVEPEELLLRVARLCQEYKAQRTIEPEPPAQDPGAINSQSPPDLIGRIDRIGLPALFSLCTSESKSGVLLVRSGVDTLWLSIREGRPLRASVPGLAHLESVEALHHAMRWTTGDFEFRESEVGGDDEFESTFMSVLMEHARRVDEENRCA